MKCSVFVATSLDGFIAKRDGSIDWLSKATAEAPKGEDFGYQSFTSRSSPSPVSVRAKARPVTYPFVAGGIPAGESSPALFG